MQNFNLRFETEKQFIEDMASALIKNHLGWSGSDEGMPSKSDDGQVSGPAWAAYSRSCFDGRAVKDVTEDEAKFVYETEFTPMVKEAGRVADKKWLAAMTLLGIEAM